MYVLHTKLNCLALLSLALYIIACFPGIDDTAQLLDSSNKMCDPEMEVQQVSLDFTDRGLTPLPEVGPEKGKAVCFGEKPGHCTSELQSVQENEM